MWHDVSDTVLLFLLKFLIVLVSHWLYLRVGEVYLRFLWDWLLNILRGRDLLDVLVLGGWLGRFICWFHLRYND
jgi:hypothetical protein